MHYQFQWLTVLQLLGHSSEQTGGFCMMKPVGKHQTKKSIEETHYTIARHPALKTDTHCGLGFELRVSLSLSQYIK